MQGRRWHGDCLKEAVEPLATTFRERLDGAEPPTRILRVGLVNNMPDAALAPTERQFRSLFQAAAPGPGLDLVLFDMPQVRRDPAIRDQMMGRYRSVEDIDQSGLDALVVTGGDPGQTPLRDSPLWPGFAGLVDRALRLRLPTLWSCLAGHAAVEYLDGVRRRPLSVKQSGVYPVTPARADPLLDGLGPSWPVPHSRHNGLDEAELVASGYEILTRSDGAGVDAFVRRGPPLFLFCQGHLEYDRDSLMREYKRDFRAYLQGERQSLPSLPHQAMPADLAGKLAHLAKRALDSRTPELMADWPPRAALGEEPPEWRPFAVGLYSNWLRALAGPAA